MSLSGAKSHHFIMTAILVSALTMCWSAEAGPASQDITIHIGRSGGSVFCSAQNNNIKDICAVFEVYNLNNSWFGFQQTTQIQRRILGKGSDGIGWAPWFQRQSFRCKVVFATYLQLRPGGKYLFDCVNYEIP
jgi:hypothetical protein